MLTTGGDRTTAGLPGYSPVGESSHFSVADVVLPLLDLFHDAVLKLCFTISTAAYSCTINLSFLSSLRPLGINLKTFLVFQRNNGIFPVGLPFIGRFRVVIEF